MSRTSKAIAKPVATIINSIVPVAKGLGKFGKNLYKDIRDEVNKEEQAKDEPVQLDLPLEDPNETAQKA